MTNILLILLLSAAPAPQDAGEGQDEILRLRNGRVLVAEVLQHDLDGLEVRTLAEGGRIRLGWSDLFPGEAERLKTGFGYKIDTAVPEVEADRLLLVNGQQIVGRILRRDERNLEIRTHEISSVIPLDRLAAPPEKVRVPATQLLTPEQFYAERIGQLEADSALRQYEFALELQEVFALEQAQKHLDRAGELAAASGDEPLARRVSVARQQLAVTLENRAQAEALEEIKQLLHRERFAQALTLLDAFDQDHPDSPLRVEYKDLEDRFEIEQKLSMERYLTRNWFDAVVAILKRRALDRDAAVDTLMTWVETEATAQVRAKMLEGLRERKADLDISEIDALWAERRSHGAKRHQASFGNGSWILGEEQATAGLRAEEKKPEDDGKTAQQRELEERTRKFLDNLERARRTSTGSQESTPEDWWRRARPTERFQFLLAYYAEFSGDYEITNVSFASCQTCGGTGVVRSVSLSSEGGRAKSQECPTCHHIGIRRSVTFR